MNAQIKIVSDEVGRLISDDSLKVVFFTHDPTGLGAQISRRLLAIRIAYIYKIRPVFLHESMYPYENCYEALSSFEKIVPDIATLPKFLFKFGDIPEYSVFDFWDFWANEEVKREIYEFIPDELHATDNAASVFEGIIYSSMNLRKVYVDYVKSSMSRLGLTSEEYIGVHYRRGDKMVEAPYVSAKRYRSAILSEIRRTGLNRVYIASDSSKARDDLNLESIGATVIYDEDEKRFNNANHKFLMKNQNLARQETLTAIKNIYILASAKSVIGQSNAHFATISTALIAAKNPGEGYGVILPGELSTANQAYRIFYTAYFSIKNFCKKIFPKMTIAGRRHD